MHVGCRSTTFALVTVLAASLAGVALTDVMTHRHLVDPASLSGLCTAAGGCEKILSSRYAHVGPVPVAALGLAFYVVSLLAWTAAVAFGDGAVRRLAVAAGAGLATVAAVVSVALMGIQFVVLRGFCPLCTTSAILCLTICACAWYLRPRRAGWDAQPVAAVLVLVPLLLAGVLAGASRSGQRADDPSVIAEVAGQPIRFDPAAAPELHDTLAALDRDAYRAKVDWAERRAAAVMLRREADARHTDPADVLARAVEGRTKDAERSVDEYLRAHPPPPGHGDLAAARGEILARLRDDAARQFVEDLKRKYDFKLHLHPPEPRESDLDPEHLGHRLGPADAPARLVVLSDFQCPGCADVSKSIDAARREFGDRLSVTYLHLPLPIHAHAEDAAVAAECAADRGKFWALHDALMTREGRLDGVDLAATLESVGVPRAAYEACRADPAVRARVEEQARHAAALGIDATPAVFLNGRRIGGDVPADELARQVRDVLRAADAR